MAKNVPAEIDRNIASTTSREEEIIQPNPIDRTLRSAWTKISVYDSFFFTFLDL